ncbi:Uncharacterised protein [Mycobacteroides abscessus subsp. abscessus]|nr:Uncharacterised protein [Mycobacteroides abscessus subsp. abscessus]
MNLASVNSCSQFSHDKIDASASAPVMKYRSASGCAVRRSVRVSTV